MSIIKKIEAKCAEKTYQMALDVMERKDDPCLFLVWYEPEYPSELLGQEE